MCRAQIERRTVYTLIYVSLFSGFVVDKEFCVSPQGHDSHAGTQSHPFATLERARAAVHLIIQSGLTEDVAVVLRGGTDRLKQTLQLGPHDGGTGQKLSKR